jgi:long-chain acyl-CoA synthetase
MVLTRIREAALRYPEHIAVQMKIEERYEQYTYREFMKSIASVSRSISEMGICSGDRLALLSENRPEWMIAYLAVLSLGAVIVPLDAQLTDDEVKLLVDYSEIKAIFVSDQTDQKIPRNGVLSVIGFDQGEKINFSDLLSAYPDAAIMPEPDDDELAVLLYTSGTTGDPKGVMLSHGNLASNCVSCMKLGIVQPYDNMLLILPLHHTYPSMTSMLLPFSTGATVTILNSLKGPDILACLQETNVSLLIGVPQLFAGLRRAIFDGIQKKPAPIRAIIKLLLPLSGELRKRMGVNIGKVLFRKVHSNFGSSLRLFASGGARLDGDVYTDMTRLGFTLIEGYGLTETSPVCTFNPVTKQKAGSIGIPIPDVEVRIANPDEKGHGEIAIRGANVMLGYYKKQHETAEVLKDGWFYSGDLGYRDRNGYFFITGRSKEMIVLATGKKIFPEELERYYKKIPSIKEICLIQGERGLEAAVVPDFDYLREMNLSNSRETIAFELEDLAKDLPPYKRITGLKIFKDPLPVTRLGKIRRTKVKELYGQSREQNEKKISEADAQIQADPVMKKLISCLGPFSVKRLIVPDDNLELDLGLDSLARVELVVSIEKSFGISLPDTFGSEVFTVKDVVLKIQQILAAGAVESGGNVKMTWTEILSQEPSDEIVSVLKFQRSWIFNVGRHLLQLILRLIFKVYGRLSVRGLENLPIKGAFIISPNHLSLADAPVVMAALPFDIASQTFSLGTTDFFGGPVSSKIAGLANVIPVDMDARLYSAMQLSAYVLRQGKILCIFPEGGRSRDGKLKEFKKGVGIIAKELNIPLIPVAIQGTFKMLPAGKYIPRPAKVIITFGKAIYPNSSDYDEIVKTIYQEIAKMLSTR